MNKKTARVVTGLERLTQDKSLLQHLKGRVALLCHSASIDTEYRLGVVAMKQLLGDRLVKLFGPQHGFVTDVQDNMIETHDFIHPYFKLPVLSLYGKVRSPTDEMLAGIDTMVVDLQDVGTRVYTYIHTLTLLMEACGRNGINVVVLDRPNPIGGELVEGNILQPSLASFVGRHPIPMRHGMTMGEIAQLAKKFFKSECELTVVSMLNWQRSMDWEDTCLPWVMPSPNLPVAIGTYAYVGTVLFEGVDISEGRGTTRPLEIVGHPAIEPFSWAQKIQQRAHEEGLDGFVLRPVVFCPTFQKFSGKQCGGVHIHPTDLQRFRPWRVGQFLLREFKRTLGSEFKWSTRPYEYQFDGFAIDFINASVSPRQWVDTLGSMRELDQIESLGMNEFMNQREQILIYR